VSKEGMNLDQLRAMLAAPVASLFLVLLLCAMVVSRPAATGFFVPVIRLHHNPNEPTDCDGLAELIRLTADERIWINGEAVQRDRLSSRIAEIMSNRAERIVYVVVDSRSSYGQFASFLDAVAGSTPELHTVVVSGEVLKAFEKDHDLCDFVYPAKEISEASVGKY